MCLRRIEQILSFQDQLTLYPIIPFSRFWLIVSFAIHWNCNRSFQVEEIKLVLRSYCRLEDNSWRNCRERIEGGAVLEISEGLGTIAANWMNPIRKGKGWQVTAGLSAGSFLLRILTGIQKIFPRFEIRIMPIWKSYSLSFYHLSALSGQDI